MIAPIWSALFPAPGTVSKAPNSSDQWLNGNTLIVGSQKALSCTASPAYAHLLIACKALSQVHCSFFRAAALSRQIPGVPSKRHLQSLIPGQLLLHGF